MADFLTREEVIVELFTDDKEAVSEEEKFLDMKREKDRN